MSTKALVLQWYRDQCRATPGIAFKASVVTVANSLLLDVTVPYIITAIISLVGAKSDDKTRYLLLVIGLLVSVGIACKVNPRRQVYRRQLYGAGIGSSLDKLEAIIQNTTGLSKTTDRTHFVAATQQFANTWDRAIIVVFEQLIGFAVGVGGLLVILCLKAPWVALIATVLLVLTGLFARRIGRVVGPAWGQYKQREIKEIGIIGDQVASAAMPWLLKILTKLRHEAGDDRHQAMRDYIGPMSSYQTSMTVLANSFKVGAVIGGVVSVFFATPPEVTTLLIVYGMSLGDKMFTIFSMNDFWSSSISEATGLMRLLEDTKPLPPILPADAERCVTFKGVTIHRTHDGADGTPVTNVIAVPDMALRPGISLVCGEKGSGKTSAGGALLGLYDYEGQLDIGRYAVRDYDVRAAVFNSPQSLELLNQPAVRLFLDIEQHQALLSKVLTWVGYANAPLDRKLSEYSGGQRESLLRAAAIYAALQDYQDDGPVRVLFLDEPTNHLDPQSIERLLEGLVALKSYAKDLIIWINSHHRGLVTIADTVIDFDKQ